VTFGVRCLRTGLLSRPHLRILPGAVALTFVESLVTVPAALSTPAEAVQAKRRLGVLRWGGIVPGDNLRVETQVAPGAAGSECCGGSTSASSRCRSIRSNAKEI